MSSPFDAKYAPILQKVIYYADQWGIPRNVAIWQIWQESSFNPNAGSSAGAQGIAQFIPSTAAAYGVNVWDIDSSLDGWGEYMSDLQKQFGNDISLALAAYNSGAGNVIKAGYKIPNISETKNYVATILRNANATPNMGGVASVPTPTVIDTSNVQPIIDNINNNTGEVDQGGDILVAGATSNETLTLGLIGLAAVFVLSR